MTVRHLFLRGNYRSDIFFDKIDMINAWNRIWLSAKATDVKIFAVVILNNHFHLCVGVGDDDPDGDVSAFMHYLRMSLSAYFNRRYKVHGSLGLRRFGHVDVVDMAVDGGEDLRDLICYIHRNPTHHEMTPLFEKWQFSTFLHMAKCFEAESLVGAGAAPSAVVAGAATSAVAGAGGKDGSGIHKVDINYFIPVRVTLPKSWSYGPDGMIIPPKELFPFEHLVGIFKDRYCFLASHCRVTERENRSEDADESQFSFASKSLRPSDNQIIEFIEGRMGSAVVNLDRVQRKEALIIARETFPAATLNQLNRIFTVPVSTIRHWIGTA